MTCFRSSRSGEIVSRRSSGRPACPLAHHVVEGREIRVLVGVVLAKVPAAALLPLEGRGGDRLGAGEQAGQIERRVPAGVVLAVADAGDLRRARLQPLDPLDRLPDVGLVAHDADVVLHQVLQLVLNLVGRLGVTGGRGPLERRQRHPLGGVDRRRVDVGGAALARELGGVLTGPLAEHQQVRQRVSAQAIGAVQASGALARREEAGDRRHLRVAVDADAAHRVVGGRADLHRHAGDVDVRQLLELVVHAGELLLDVLGPLGEALLDPGDVEEDAAVRAAAPLAHLFHDLARHVVAGEELGRTARVLVPLRVLPPLFLAVGRLRFVVVRDVVEHEALAVLVAQHAPLAAHALGHEDPLHRRRPDHPGRVELDELHVHQIGARVVGQRVAVAGVLPAVAGDLEGAARRRRWPARSPWP